MNPEDPKVFGPKVWNRIHTNARNAITLEQKNQFIHYFQKEMETLPCPTCRSHALQYIEEIPIDLNIIINDQEGIDASVFYYTWEFHNLVNEHLNKPQITWQQACLIYKPKKIEINNHNEIQNDKIINTKIQNNKIINNQINNNKIINNQIYHNKIINNQIYHNKIINYKLNNHQKLNDTRKTK